MALVELTTWSETDPNNRIVVDNDQQITVTGIKRNETAYLASPDYPVDSFNGDFQQEVICQFNVTANSSLMAVWAQVSVNDDIQGLRDAAETYYAVWFSRQAGGTRSIVIDDYDGGANSDNTLGVYVPPVATDITFVIIRDTSIGAFGRLSCDIWEGGILKDTISIATQISLKNYRKLQTVTSRDQGVNAALNALLTKFDDGLITAAAYYQQLIRNNRSGRN